MDNNQVNQKTNTDREMLIEIFKDQDSADKAIKALETKGYTKDEINIITSDVTRDKYFKDGKTVNAENQTLKGAGAGSAIGLTLGALIGGILAVGSVVIPGVGLIVAGPLAAALAGAGAGSLTGGLVGALTGWGVSEVKAKKYEKAIKEGKIVVAVRPHSDEDAKMIEKEWAVYKEEPVYI
ncbi:MAG: general stress protein [Bacteroidota bacterium]